MTAAVCTGYGGRDTHAVTLNDGRKNPHSSAGQPYGTIDAQRIFSMVANPPSVPKDQGQWIIASTYNAYDARAHEAQRAHGQYHWMCIDIDKGDPSMADVSAIVGMALGNVWHLIYSTRSSTPSDKKWRVLVPLAEPLSGAEYGAYQAALFDGLEHGGLLMDRTLERAGQLVYLPNKGEFYQYQADPAEALFSPRNHPMAARAQQYMELHAAAEAAVTGQERNEGDRSPLRAFREKHSIAEMLRLYGYEQQGGTDHWRSPYQDSSSYGTQDRGDHWISLSHSDAAAGIGRATPNGSRYGDAFDLYVHFQCGGNVATAMQYAQQCLKEKDDALYGLATKEHGWEVWQGLERIGNQYGPAGHRIALAESAQRAEELKTPEPEEDHEIDWDIPWPPGICGEMAKHIYNASSRPVKQFAIASALYMLAGVAGQRYNIEGGGLNLYFAMVGNSGTGKGEARRNTKRLYGQIGHAAQDPQGIAATFDHDFPASAPGLNRMFKDGEGTKAIYREDADALMEMLTASQPGSNGDLLRTALSTFWDHSGDGLNMGGRSYAKDEDSTAMIQSPSLTVGFDFQVEPFKRFLGHSVILTTGIGGRFIYVTRYGKRAYHQDRKSKLPGHVLEAMKNLWQATRLNHTVTLVKWAEGVREAYLKVDHDCTTRINEEGESAELLNRAHSQGARVAACLAVAQHHLAPVVTMEMWEWAIQFVMRGYEECLKLMKGGEVGSGERVRVAKAIKAVGEYVRMTPGKRHSGYKVPKAIDNLDDIICERYMLEKLRGQADFKGSDIGLTSEDIVRRTIKELIAQDYLIPTTVQEVMEERSILIHKRFNQPLYKLGSAF